MSKTKAGGSTKLGRDSESKRLGVKVFGGQTVTAGSILIRQRGTKYGAGTNTKLGKDYTIFSLVDGTVRYRQNQKQMFSGLKRRQTVVSVDPK